MANADLPRERRGGFYRSTERATSRAHAFMIRVMFQAVQIQMPLTAPPISHINLVQNWFAELNAKVPAGR